uniref:Monocarboxylate transporter 9 n=1 Tax=Hemiscolopendra marginata TaxID=943146 RepID=A0A646QDR5_9MYRI
MKQNPTTIWGSARSDGGGLLGGSKKSLQLVAPSDFGEKKLEAYTWEAPDGDWGWMVLLGTVIVNTLIPGLIKSFGVLFVEFLNVFQASPSAAAWIPGLTFALYNLLGPVASALSNRFSCRFTTTLGGLCAALGLALSYFATSIEFLYFSYGLLGGIGAGLSYTPGVLIVGRYFEKRRGLANGICMSGSALGSIILPPFLNFLLSEYGYRGAILIMCGVVLNVCVGAGLYHPVEWHLKRVPKEPSTFLPQLTQPTSDASCPTPQRSSSQTPGMPLRERKVSWQVLHLANAGDRRNSDDDREPAGTDEAALLGHMTGEPVDRHNNPLLARLLRDVESNPRLAPRPQPDGGEVILDGGLVVSPDDTTIATAGGGPGFRRERSAADVTALRTIRPTADGGGVASTFGSRSGINGDVVRTPRLRRTLSVTSTLSSSSFAFMSTIHLGSTAAAYQHTEVAQLGSMCSLPSQQHSLYKGKNRKVFPCCPYLGAASLCHKLFDMSLMTNLVFLLITYSFATSGIAYTNLLIVLPAHSLALGIQKAEYAALLSIIAGSDLTGRVGGAWFSDLGLFPRKYFFVVGLLVSGIAMACLPIAVNFNQMAVVCSVFGLSSGVYIGLMAVLLMDHLGSERLASSFGLSLAMNGIVMLAGPPAVGLVRERIGSYVPVLYMMGFILISGAAVWILEPLATRHEMSKVKNGKKNAAAV